MGANPNNQITYERNGKLINCFIHISGKKKLIGTINETNRTLTKRISKQLHTFRAGNSIAIAHELLKLDYDFIKIESGYDTFKTTRKFFLEHSNFKQFGSYELQKFLPISDFGLEKAMAWERESCTRVQDVSPVKVNLQMELFNG